LLFLDGFPEKTKENLVLAFLTRAHFSGLEIEFKFSTDEITEVKTV
jgi:hypothetical protein